MSASAGSGTIISAIARAASGPAPSTFGRSCSPADDRCDRGRADTANRCTNADRLFPARPAGGDAGAAALHLSADGLCRRARPRAHRRRRGPAGSPSLGRGERPADRRALRPHKGPLRPAASLDRRGGAAHRALRLVTLPAAGGRLAPVAGRLQRPPLSRLDHALPALFRLGGGDQPGLSRTGADHRCPGGGGAGRHRRGADPALRPRPRRGPAGGARPAGSGGCHRRARDSGHPAAPRAGTAGRSRPAHPLERGHKADRRKPAVPKAALGLSRQRRRQRAAGDADPALCGACGRG